LEQDWRGCSARIAGIVTGGFTPARRRTTRNLARLRAFSAVTFPLLIISAVFFNFWPFRSEE